MRTDVPLLEVIDLQVELRAGSGGAGGAVRLLSHAHVALGAGAMLPIAGGPPLARLAVLEVLAGRRAPDGGQVRCGVASAAIVRRVVSGATGDLLARAWLHLPGAPRRGRARPPRARPEGTQLHLLLADGEGPADRPFVERAVAALRAGDGMVLALPGPALLPALARRGWQLAGGRYVAALSRAS